MYAVVPCAGTGVRSGAAGPKQYVALAGRPMVLHTLRALCAVQAVDRVQVVLAPDDEVFAQQVLPLLSPDEALRISSSSSGGPTRAQTVLGGLHDLLRCGAQEEDWVLVHDAARCLVRPLWIQRLIDACQQATDHAGGAPVGGLLALPIADTLKAESTGRVACTVDRQGKWAAQTPQMFTLGLLRAALQGAGGGVTDESSAMEAAGHQPLLVPGSVENFKVTYPDDFALAERLLATRGP